MSKNVLSQTDTIVINRNIKIVGPNLSEVLNAIIVSNEFGFTLNSFSINEIQVVSLNFSKTEIKWKFYHITGCEKCLKLNYHLILMGDIGPNII